MKLLKIIAQGLMSVGLAFGAPCYVPQPDWDVQWD